LLIRVVFFALESPFRGSLGLFWATFGRKISVRRGLFFRHPPNIYSRANMEPIWSRVGPFWSQLSIVRRTCEPETSLFVSKISVRRGLFFRHPANTYSRAKIEPIWSRGGPFWSQLAPRRGPCVSFLALFFLLVPWGPLGRPWEIICRFTLIAQAWAGRSFHHYSGHEARYTKWYQSGLDLYHEPGIP